MLDIYVKDKNNKWQIIYIFNDESVLMEFKTSDLKELDRAYTVFSQDFIIPSSSRNNVIFDYFFDTNTNHQKVQFYDAQIFINGAKNRVGRIGVVAGTYENDKLKTYSVSFYSGVQPLKDKIGEDSLKDLDYSNMNLYWNLGNISDLITGQSNTSIKVPLISVNRAWNTESNDANNILTNPINIGELRPCVKVSTLIDKIESKYGLNIDFTPQQTNILDKMYVWCNKEQEEVNQISLIPHNAFTVTQSPTNRPNNDDASKYPNIIKTTKGFRIIETSSPNITNCQLSFTLINPRKQLDDERYEDIMSIRLVETDSAGNFLKEIIIDCQLQADYNYIGWVAFSNRNSTKYYEAYAYGKENITIQSYNVLVRAVNMDVYNTSNNTRYLLQRTSSNNTPAITANLYNFSKSLDYPIIDFLSSIIKTFNLKILEDKNNIYHMKWLNSFHNETIDITPYTDLSDKKVESQQRYKKVKFTHSEEDYLRNEAFRSLTGREYGSEIYESESTDLSEEFEIETGFSILSYVVVPNTNIITSYGFDSDLKPVDPSAPTIFFVNERQAIFATNSSNQKADIRLKYGATTTVLNHYIPFSNTNGFNDLSTTLALTFNNEIYPIDNEVCESNLYSKFYDLDFRKIYANNTYINDFTAHLPPHILNQISMQNTLIIRDKKYSIYEMSIDMASGKSELKLIDFYKAFEDNSNLVYPPFFGASYESENPSQFRYAINQGQNISAEIEIAQYVIEYTNTTTGVTQQHTLTAVPMQSMSGLINSGGGTFNVRAKCISVTGANSDWTPITIVAVLAPPVQTIYPPTFYPYFDAEYSGRIQYNINLGMQNTVQPTHYRIEWIRTSNGLSQTTTIVAVQNQSMLGQINSGTGTFNVRAQCVVNGVYGQWTSLTQVIVS